VGKKQENIDKELTVKSSTENLSLIRNFTRKTAETCGFKDEAVGKIVLAVDEACTNIIKHAYHYSPSGDIILKFKLVDSKFTISITDKGLHFNPEIVPEPNLKEFHKQRKVGGLGMYLMKKLMDEVVYHSLTGRKNEVILVKYLT
jgi:serine/threonine-protein kinase RsbW